jgi:hypothetical protein
LSTDRKAGSLDRCNWSLRGDVLRFYADRAYVISDTPWLRPHPHSPWSSKAVIWTVVSSCVDRAKPQLPESAQQRQGSTTRA